MLLALHYVRRSCCLNLLAFLLGLLLTAMHLMQTTGSGYVQEIAEANWTSANAELARMFYRQSQEQSQGQLQQSFNEVNSTAITTTHTPPYFESNTQCSVMAALGRLAKLHCKVQNLGDRAVSWIRQRDLHILTIGAMTYTNDQRFETQHLEDSNEWVLKISSVQPRDSGIYECQVSTEPKISEEFRLTVLVAKAKILANPELVFKSGSDINLTCIAQQAPTPPSYIYWYKDGELINYSQRGGINVLTERLTKTSKLLIARVQPNDSGNYTCLPSNSNADSVFVHVIKSEHPAAMQHEHATPGRKPNMFLCSLTLTFLAVLHRNNLDKFTLTFVLCEWR